MTYDPTLHCHGFAHTDKINEKHHTPLPDMSANFLYSLTGSAQGNLREARRSLLKVI